MLCNISAGLSYVIVWRINDIICGVCGMLHLSMLSAAGCTFNVMAACLICRHSVTDISLCGVMS